MAIEISIEIMDAFGVMRKYIGNNLIEQKFSDELVIKDNKRVDLLERINSVGSRTYSIHILEDEIIKEQLLQKITKL